MSVSPQTAMRSLYMSVVFVAFVLSARQQACGQITAANYNETGDYAYQVQSMPDLDQVRSGLQNNGNWYCVPTACMNLCGFAANFGFPNLPPGPGFWEGNNNYNQMTNFIGFMGLYMNTEPFPDEEGNGGGTGGTGKINGMNNWINDSGQALFTVAEYPDNDYWPTIDNAAIHGINGAVVQISYGRYDWQPIAGRPYLTDRTGGHAVTLNLAFANNGQIAGPRLIHYRDPASEQSDLFSNSNYVSTNANTAANIEIGSDIFADIPICRNVTALRNPPPVTDSGNQYWIMDSFLALYPSGGVVYGGTQLNAMFVTGGLGFAVNQQPDPYTPLNQQQIIAATSFVEPHSSLALVSTGPNSPSNQLVQIPHNGRFQVLGELPATTHGLDLGFGRKIFVAGDHYIIKLIVIPGQRMELVETIMMPPESAEINDIAYAESIGKLIVVAGNQIFLVDRETGSVSRGFRISGVGNVPNPIRTIMVREKLAYAALQNGGVAVVDISRPQVSSLVAASGDFRFEQLNLVGLVNAMSVDVDSGNRMFVSDLVGGLKEFEFDPQDGWNRANNPLYGNFPLQGRIFESFKNRANIREGDLNPNQWYNIEPVELVPLGSEVPDN